MTQANPPSRMTQFRIWWQAADAVLAALGQPPLDYTEARLLFDSEVEPEDVPALLSRIEA